MLRFLRSCAERKTQSDWQTPPWCPLRSCLCPSTLERSLQDYEKLARQHLKKLEAATLVKFSTDQPRVSYLSYPDFDTDAHSALQWSVQVDLVTSQVGARNYNSTDNPPVLHRKETFVTSDYPLYQPFAELTRSA